MILNLSSHFHVSIRDGPLWCRHDTLLVSVAADEDKMARPSFAFDILLAGDNGNVNVWPSKEYTSHVLLITILFIRNQVADPSFVYLTGRRPTFRIIRCKQLPNLATIFRGPCCRPFPISGCEQSTKRRIFLAASVFQNSLAIVARHAIEASPPVEQHALVVVGRVFAIRTFDILKRCFSGGGIRI